MGDDLKRAIALLTAAKTGVNLQKMSVFI